MGSGSAYMPICIIGPGATGTLFAVTLKSAAEIWICGRSRIDTPLQLSGYVKKTLDVADFRQVSLEGLDLVPRPAVFLVCVKTYSLKDVLTQLSASVRNSDIVALAQNGFGLIAYARKFLGGDIPLVRLLLRSGVKKINNSLVELAGPLDATVAYEAGGRTGAGFLLQKLKNAGFNTVTSDNISKEEWKKLILNLAINSVCTITGTRNGEILKNPVLKSAGLAIINEAFAVAGKEGIFFESDTAESILQQAELSASNYNSTLCDIKAGRQTEREFIFTPVIECAVRNGVPVPVLSAMNNILAFLETRTSN